MLPASHDQLVSSQTGIDAILNFLSGEPAILPQSLMSLQQSGKPIKPDKQATALLIIVEGAHATLTDKDGNQTNDSEGQITILDPHEEAYTLTIDPGVNRWPWWRKMKYRVIVVQLFDDGTSSWKEYSRIDQLKKHWKLRFDRKYKRNDILHDS